MFVKGILVSIKIKCMLKQLLITNRFLLYGYKHNLNKHKPSRCLANLTLWPLELIL